jgi:hypothetical protein
MFLVFYKEGYVFQKKIQFTTPTNCAFIFLKNPLYVFYMTMFNFQNILLQE